MASGSSRNNSQDQPRLIDITAWRAVSSPDVICYLVPRLGEAGPCVARLAEGPHATSKHVIPRLQKDDHWATHAIALRLSSELADPLRGFTFGRGPKCDVPLTSKAARRDPNLALEHFRIFLDEETGVPVVQDSSVVGTLVDNVMLLASRKRKSCGEQQDNTSSSSSEERNSKNSKPLKNGSIIIVSLSDGSLSFSVRIPQNRTEEHRELYETNLRSYQRKLRLKAVLSSEKKTLEVRAKPNKQ
ncbi:ser/thr/tyr protein kinase RAD53 [Apiospora aurea]|uniref:Ser/thr/tyr protein kinase RAD53 n=1 Tax=Apiospora aurea TaxID=335848 RepID=A0ABR1PUF1_9PEZI